MAKLNKILESIENLKLTTEVALLENTEVTELVRAQSKLMINENINFIKNELTKGGILEDVQFMLKNAWTQALMEDISMDTFRNMIPTGEDVDKFAKNIYNTGKDFANENIPKYTSNEYNGMKTAADSLLSDTQGRHAAAIADLNSQHANALAAINAQHANEVGGLKADIGSYQNSQAGLISTLGGNGAKLGVQADSVYADGVNKANQLAGQAQAAYGQAKDMVNAIPGQAQAAYGQAKDMANAIPGQAQAAYDSGKAAVQAVPGQVAALGAKIGANVQGVYDGASQGLGAKLNADGSPMTNNQMAGIGAGSAAIAAGAGYGAHKLAQKVRRSNTFR